MSSWSGLPFSLLAEVLFPERCLLCGRPPDGVPWTPEGPRVTGLRAWDRTHLCRPCYASLLADPVCGQRLLPKGPPLTVRAASWTHPALVRLVGEWKYQGIRGLSWPLARLAAACLDGARPEVQELVPVPLHPHRRRHRGFNQAALLARLLSAERGIPVNEEVLARVKRTGQQARIQAAALRRANTALAFRARTSSGQKGGRVGLIDDLVTSGSTAAAAAQALREAGWEVAWVLCLGLARSPVDRQEG